MGHAVLSAPPGSGKTTRVPLSLLQETWLADQRILMLEPRRPAARMAAARMARLLDQAVGDTVGYQVRFDRRIGARTRIEVLTDGILTRRLQGDPGLEGVGLLIFDEFHERSLQADLGLALALDAAAALREDLRVLVMSATLDAGAVSGLLGGAAVIQGSGRTHPVEVIYAERRPAGDPQEAVVSGVRRALSEREGDVLAFLPGAGEIRRARERLQAVLTDETEVLPLHGDLSASEQDRALRANAGPARRVVLSTDIAETSVTIEGVSCVVDGGLARKPRFNPATGLTRLVTEPVSRASADQRTGRAGRIGPGTCYRMWTLAQEVGRPNHRPAEILQADLAPLVMELALWGVRDPSELLWLDPPPEGAWSRAASLMRQLGALDAHGTLTSLGRKMAQLSVHPRLARMLVGAPAEGARRLAADLAALLSDRDPWLTERGGPRPVDLTLRCQAVEDFRRFGQAPGTDRRRLAAADRLSSRLLRGLGAERGHSSPEPGGLLALAYPDRIAKRRPGAQGRYLLAAGPGVVLPDDDPLSVHEILVVADLDVREREGRVRLALPVSETALRVALGHQLEARETLYWDANRQAVAARREERLGALVVSSQPCSLADPERSAALLMEQVGRRFEQSLPWRPEARQLQARVALLRRMEPDGGWPDISDDWLKEHLAEWLSPSVAGKQSLAQLQALDLHTALLALMDWEHRNQLQAQAPPALKTPAGNRRRLDYKAAADPVLAVPLQEMFGAGDTPTVCRGRVPVTLHLLSPARRPVQVTQDLAGFWAGGYAEVRKELRGRYPKHHWPEDPANAHPVTGGVKKRR